MTAKTKAATPGGPETFGFQAEVSKLLDIVAHSLYSEKQIFLRELISNGSDACDRLRYAALTQPDLVADDPEFRISLSADKKAGTLTVSDNGIGMNREDLVDALGTIARSGTTAFLESLSAAAKAGGKTGGKPDLALIGQFGVGFYSAFMVAEQVEVLSRKAGEAEAWLWASDGKGEFTVAPAERPGRGTSVVLYLAKAEREFLEPERLRHVVKTYSDHIAIPIVLADGGKEETLNQASALWTRRKAEITPEQYAEFYRHVGHGFDEPWLTLHWKAEGKLEYTSLLYVPSHKPFDLFHPDRRHGVKLYVKRVFITDDCEELVPRWLRFLRGVVDSEDLPLNISREMLQHNPILGRIRSGLVKRVLGELKKKAEKAPEDYAQFWDNFGAVLKEGLYEEAEPREDLLALARFRSTRGQAGDDEGLITLDDYVGRMKPGQEHIYYITGEDAEALRSSPQIEGFKARGVEVLTLSDSVDEFWLPAVAKYKDKSFKSVTRAGTDLSGIEAEGEEGKPGKKAKEKTAPPPAEIETLIALLKLSLKDAVSDVRVSERLTDSAVCLVAGDSGLDMNLERLLKQHGQIDAVSARILELNPGHPLIAKLAKLAGEEGAADRLEDAAHLLLDQARILEGEPLPEPAAFARRMARVMEGGLAAGE